MESTGGQFALQPASKKKKKKKIKRNSFWNEGIDFTKTRLLATTLLSGAL